MGKMVLLAAAFFLAAATAPAAFAQGVVAAPPPGSVPPRADGSLYRGAYEVTEEGALIYGGDVSVRCEQVVDLGPDPPLTGEAVELRAEAGFPPEGAASGAPAAAGAAGGDGPKTLPGTGGPPFVALRVRRRA